MHSSYGLIIDLYQLAEKFVKKICVLFGKDIVAQHFNTKRIRILPGVLTALGIIEDFVVPTY